ncbi:hypothetical protein [Streptomyces sp. S-9]|uniref:hypothetical protein n=1 Tax=Streptomyces sp. S-9 TaxID=2806600 RepID=UPI00193BABB8|nr:hypothetical protein [Streptomyces sp. S-9]
MSKFYARRRLSIAAALTGLIASVGLFNAPAASAADPHDDEFTAEHAASSLAGFQQGTFRARDAVGDEPQDGPPRVPAPASGHPTPTADADR